MSVSKYNEFIEALAAGGKVSLAAGAKITITASTQIRRSGTRITSDDPKNPGTLVLESGASWSGPLLYATGLTDLTFDNIIIDGNFDSQGGKPRGKGYFNLCNLKNCQQIVIHDMQMRDGGNDGFQFRGCKYIEAYDNKIQYLGHDAFYFIGLNSEIEVYGNNVLTFTNSAVRLAYGCTNAWIHDNYFHSVFTGGSTGPAIEIDKHGFAGILIENNIIENINGAGIWMTGDALNTGSIVIRNCVFYNTGVYKTYTGYSNAGIVNGNMTNVIVENCTFVDGNVGFSSFDRNGLSMSFKTTFKNCVFAGADIAAIRMPDSGASAEFINCNFYGNKALAIGSYTDKISYTNISTSDPKLDEYKVGKTSELYGKGIGYAATTLVQPIENDEESESETPVVNTTDCDTRLVASSPRVVFTKSPYVDVGKSASSTYRSLLYFDLSEYKEPVAKAELQLCWYYPAGKTRANDSVVEVYRPAAWADGTATWSANASKYYDNTGAVGCSKPYASLTFGKSTLPDNKYYTWDVTKLVNEYIAGTYQNTGFMIKTALELNDYIAFYSILGTSKPKLVITETPVEVTTSVKLPLTDTKRLKEREATATLDNNVYLDIGKSSGAARIHAMFDISKFKQPVKSAQLMLAWYYPAGKSRTADTVISGYRPLTATSANETWATAAERYDKTKAYGKLTIKAAVLPDGKFEVLDITELVNAYINGTYTNTGILLKAISEANNYIAFHGEMAIEDKVKPYILIQTSEDISNA